jgi:hypothetical protein
VIYGAVDCYNLRFADELHPHAMQGKVAVILLDLTHCLIFSNNLGFLRTLQLAFGVGVGVLQVL